MIDPKRELFQWGPIDGKPTYISGFADAFGISSELGMKWPDVLHYFETGTVTIFVDHEHLFDAGEIVLNEMARPRAQECFDEWLPFAESVEEWAKRPSVTPRDYEEWLAVQREFWVKGFVPELANWGGERVLQKLLAERHPDNFSELYEALCAPEKYSFFQEEEIALLEIAQMENRDEALQQHQENYFWLRNSYGHTEVLSVEFFAEEIGKLSQEETEKRLREIKEYPERIRKRKDELIEKYAVDDEIVQLSECMSFCIWWQDLRKKYIFMANHVLSQFAKAVSQATEISFEDLENYTVDELTTLLASKTPLDVSSRSKGYVLYYHERGELENIEGSQAKELFAKYTNTDADENQPITGLVVSKGPVLQGVARIVRSPREIDHFNDGDVLVAPMTSPDFVVAMRKASAIITDEGGMTSHAAIVSRELQKPCIVGTKVATKLLKDGDMVEVDTEEGVVKKI